MNYFIFCRQSRSIAALCARGFFFGILLSSSAFFPPRDHPSPKTLMYLRTSPVWSQSSQPQPLLLRWLYALPPVGERNPEIVYLGHIYPVEEAQRGGELWVSPRACASHDLTGKNPKAKYCYKLSWQSTSSLKGSRKKNSIWESRKTSQMRQKIHKNAPMCFYDFGIELLSACQETHYSHYFCSVFRGWFRKTNKLVVLF